MNTRWFFLMVFLYTFSSLSARQLNQHSHLRESLEAFIESQDILTGYDEPGGERSRLGETMVIEGDRAFVSAAHANGHGVVFVFALDENGSWVKESYIEPPDGKSDDRFGEAISVYGNTMAIGTSQHSATDSSCDGAVYIFEEQNQQWSLLQKIVPVDECGSSNIFFSAGLHLDGNHLMVGQPYSGDNASGAVLVYKKSSNGWIFEDKLEPQQPSDYQTFGNSISVSGNWMLIGSVAHLPTVASDYGSAYFFAYENGQWVEKQRVSGNPNNSLYDQYGQSVALSDSRAFIGVPSDDMDSGPAAGSVRVLELENGSWVEKDKLAAVHPNIGGYDYFGISLDVSGDYVLIGSPNSGASLLSTGYRSSGVAYLYLYTDQGLQTTEVYVPTGQITSLDDFASSVALHSNYVMAEKLSDNDQGNDAGAVYSYQYGTENSLKQKVTVDGVGYDFFGDAMEIYENMALVGAKGADINGTWDAGMVYVFEYDGSQWQKHSEIFASNPERFANFGSSISVSGNTVMIGAPVVKISGATVDSDITRGAVYVFEYDGANWQQVDKIEPSALNSQIHFGSKISLNGDRAVISATASSVATSNILSSVFVFERENGVWVEKQQIPDPSVGENIFGHSLQLVGDDILIGAPFDGDSHLFGGAIYVYSKINDSWTVSDKLLPPEQEELSLSIFGINISALGDKFVTYSRVGNSLIGNKSAIHFYEKTGDHWGEIQRVESNLESFGNGLAMLGDMTLTSCSTGGFLNLCIYRQENGQWVEKRVIKKVKTERERFGAAIQIMDNQLLVSNPISSSEGVESGVVYTYKMVDDLIFANGFNEKP